MNKLILLRHGQSLWNFENRFTGWKDIPLTEKGIKEAEDAGNLMQKHNFSIDLVFTSILERAIETAKIAIKQMHLDHLWKKNELIIKKNKALNERDYGNLVGLNKKQTSLKYGEEQVHIWRRSFDISPPGGESLEQVLERVKKYFDIEIAPEIKNNKNILISAHGNSLRAMMIHLDLYKPKEISKIEIPTGKPFVLYFENNKLVKSDYLI
tara:strand:+ start:1131 stop:1760 length:630 start_codon:yes stop_codon:yes gene_type:complete